MIPLSSAHGRSTLPGRLGLVVAIGLVAAAGGPAAAAAPSATMVPTTGLVDGQRTTIRASGLPPRNEIQVLECQGTATNLPKSARQCDAVTLDSSGTADQDGNYINTPGDLSGSTEGYRISVLPSATFKTVSIRCGPSDPCLLYVGVQLTDFSKPHTFIPFAFAGATGSASGHQGGSSSGATPAVAALAVVVVGGTLWLWRRSRRNGNMARR